MRWFRQQLSFLLDVLRGCLSPGPLPKGWGIVPVIFLAVLVALGMILSTKDQWEWHRLFAEGRPGTYLSVALLMANGLVCIWICRGLTKRCEWKNDAWKPLHVFLGLLVVVLVAAAAMFLLGDHWHDRRHYYFSPRRLGRWFDGSLYALTLLGAWTCYHLKRCRFTRFWFLFGSLLCWMALDDLLMFHEDAAKWLTVKKLGLPTTHLVSVHLNDFFVLCYGFVAIGLAYGYRERLAQLRWMINTMLLACVFFVGTVAADFGEWGQWQEETMKVLAAALILCSLVMGGLELRARYGSVIGTPLPFEKQRAGG